MKFSEPIFTLPKRVLFIYSGKGGVGKSTFCVNLAYAMALQGIKIGIFDADLFGPSIPVMVNQIEKTPPRFDNFRILPGRYGDVWINSLGFISKPIEGGYWHGKYLEGLLNQLLFKTDWQDIDMLLIDMPPGVGELHRMLLHGVEGQVLLITTPQDLSYNDTIRAIEMSHRMKKEIIGIVENMSYYNCQCGLTVKIFEGNTEESLCKPFDLNILLKMPLNSRISQYSNKGIPFILKADNNDQDKESIMTLGRMLFPGQVSNRPLETW